MGIKLLSDIAEVKDIKLQNAAGAETGRIQSVGNDLVFSNAVGDILIGDGASDIYIGDGANNVDILFEQSGSIKAEDGSSGVTLTLGSSDTTLALGSSISSATTIIGDFTVGVNDTGHDVKFFGATSGAYMLWDESEDGLVITHPTNDAGLEIYTISSGAPSVSQFKVGRDANQYWGVHTVDTQARLIHRQDETDSSSMHTDSEIWSSASGNDSWRWRLGTNTGSSLATVMTLDKAGQLTVTGEIEGGSLDINGNADISGNLTVEGTTILDGLQLEATGDYITFYGGNSTQHSITSRQLAGGTGDDLRFNTYGSYIINLDSNNNQGSAANSSFYITRHGGDNGDASGNVLFDINGENGDATFTAAVIIPNLPTSDPSVAGQLWNSSGDLKVSAG